MNVCQTGAMRCIAVPQGNNSHCPIHQKNPKYRASERKESWDKEPRKVIPTPWDDAK